MATVVPPPPIPPPPASPAPAPAVTVISPPPAVSQLAVGAELLAAVASRPQPGQVAVNTNLGPLLLQTRVALPQNAQLQLQVAKLVPQVELLVKAINGFSTITGKPVTSPAAGQAGSPGQAPPAGDPETVQPRSGAPGGAAGESAGRIAQAAARGDSIQFGATLKAMVVRIVPLPAATGATVAGVPSPPAAPAGPGPAAASPSPGAAQGSPVSAPLPRAIGSPGRTPGTATPGQGATPPSFAPGAGTELTIRLLAVAPPNQPVPVPAAPSNPAAQVVSGTVTGATPAGLTLVQTPGTVLALATATPLPQGADVAFEVIGQARPAPAVMPSGGFERMYLARDWPSLDEALASLSHSAPAAAQQLATTVIPRADNLLTANILFFLAALRGGDMRSWFGDAALRMLERERPDLGGRLSDDFAQLSRAFNEPGSGDWRTALVPFFNGSHLEQVRMHLRGQRDDEEETETTRFIIDVQMSRLGRVQLDGLVVAKSKRLDLIVRTARQFPPGMRQDIYRIFTEAAEATGITGGLQFQADSRFVDIDVIGDRPQPRILV